VAEEENLQFHALKIVDIDALLVFNTVVVLLTIDSAHAELSCLKYQDR
jgi:hypothetical protein